MLPGTAELIAKLNAIEARGRKAALDVLDEVLDVIWAESQELVPTSPYNATIEGPDGPIPNPFYTGHPGALRDSGKVVQAVFEGDQVAGHIVYTASYALYVHEHTGKRHGAALKAAFPAMLIANERGQAKFLSVPMLKRRRALYELLNERLREIMHG